MHEWTRSTHNRQLHPLIFNGPVAAADRNKRQVMISVRLLWEDVAERYELRYTRQVHSPLVNVPVNCTRVERGKKSRWSQRVEWIYTYQTIPSTSIQCSGVAVPKGKTWATGAAKLVSTVVEAISLDAPPKAQLMPECLDQRRANGGRDVRHDRLGLRGCGEGVKKGWGRGRGVSGSQRKREGWRS